jgi:Tfp pilus assembly protein PilO
MADTGRYNVAKLWVPIGSVGVAAAFIATAAITWATDKAELSATSATVRKHAEIIDTYKEERAARRVTDEQIRDQLKEMRNAIDRIAERVGAKQ